MTRVIDPTPESFRALSRTVPAGVPIVMLNLLRFRPEAAYPPGSPHAPCTGREAYARYTAHALGAVAAAGAEVVFHGSALAHPIAPPDEQWDEILLVAYPSVGAFLQMVMAPDYQAQSVHRTAALEDARLVCTQRGG
ncbi:MAG: DUF1330 domain-containing protein [Sandaracinaceae bacterium]|jgi:uncharacterized protein (DUF1330 family)|nr:DUF1330 domain-containing protein [Sandaracinaceae bacterium]MBP7680690.1 DUF1330 domain-containing protein [Deltaproteobacteria bacterium]MBK6812430.1 DUF1330 domain-containing protein [Sandaracinaceae bacterium]MBK7150709.1 DUF1330 domain-containing protein [Sandaracinaceae bacterium]MBK7777606.1 DUF1330 domain-containing protein [Sandaracinaceae bacterium]